jgi:hypothetical protein
LASAGEFRDENGVMPKPGLLQRMARVYGQLGYDAGLLFEAEKSALEAVQAAVPLGFIAPRAPDTALARVGDRTVGLIFLPDTYGKTPPSALMTQVVETAASLSGKVDLVIGLSSWGIDAEQLLIGRADGAFHILIGGGSGRGLVGMPMAFGKTLWVRPYSDGKGVGRIDAFSWPEPGKADVWINSSLRFDVLPLRDDLPDDPAVAALLAGS